MPPGTSGASWGSALQSPESFLARISRIGTVRTLIVDSNGTNFDLAGDQIKLVLDQSAWGYYATNVPASGASMVPELEFRFAP